MRAAWYETQGPARDVLKVGLMADPTPALVKCGSGSRRRASIPATSRSVRTPSGTSSPVPGGSFLTAMVRVS